MALANSLGTANIGDATPLGGNDYFNHFDNPNKALWCSVDENVVMDIISESVSALPN